MKPVRILLSPLLCGLMLPCLGGYASAEESVHWHGHQQQHSRWSEQPPQAVLPNETSLLNETSLPFETKVETSTLTNTPLRHLAQDSNCSVAELEQLQGARLVDQLTKADDECLRSLYQVTGSRAASLFDESQMVTVANAIATRTQRYDGRNGETLLPLIRFMRAGYYVQWYHRDDVGEYGNRLRVAVRSALDGFVANRHFHDVTEEHGKVLAEVITLIDSSTENGRYIDSVLSLLQRYNAQYNEHWSMRSAVNGVFTVLFRGHQFDEFKARAAVDTNIIHILDQFVSRHDSLLGGDSGFVVENAARELTRFLQYDGAVKRRAQQAVKQFLTRYQMIGDSAGLWTGVADVADYHDGDNCADYGICNFRDQLQSQVLPVQHNCSETIAIRAQSIALDQMAETCETLSLQESYFHQQLETNYNPVTNDNNRALEIVVFDSSTDYKRYASVLFGINTDNGGMYLEGDPQKTDNQARFIAYEAEWKRPEFKIWNLQHEYVHYLDGRFNLYGDFNQSIEERTVWWIEGLGEYIAHRKYNDTAVELARGGGVELSEILANDYNSGVERIYRWGYLAVRFMFERHPQDVREILNNTRSGDYDAYSHYMAFIGTRYDHEFADWLQTVESVDEGDTGGSTPTYRLLKSKANVCVTLADDNQTIGAQACDGSTGQQWYQDTDGRIESAQQPGYCLDAQANPTYYSLVALQPCSGSLSQRWQQEGEVLISSANQAMVMDVYQQQKRIGLWGRHDGDNQRWSWVDSDGGDSGNGNGNGNGNGGSDNQDPELQNGVAKTGIASEGNVFYYFYVPEGATGVEFSLEGGMGDADLYVTNNSRWPSTANYDYIAAHHCNRETVRIEPPQTGRYFHVMVHAYSPFSGAKLTARHW